MFKKESIHCHENLVIVEGTWIRTNIKCIMFNVYAPQDARKKRELWQYLISYMSKVNGAFIVFGNFNVVRSFNERCGSLFCASQATDFNQFIYEAYLFDIPMEGRKFTRVDKVGAKLSRFDRFLIFESLLDVIPDISCIALDRRWSDHCLVLLKKDQNDYGPISLKLFNPWLQMDGFSDVVSQAVRDFSPDCNLNKCINMKNKLNFVKAKIKGWQADMRKLKGEQRKACINRLLNIDNLIDSGVASDDVMAERKNILQ
ncbi:uncharacterized protein LOC111886893 [Lactuca sativa]|uniref:uncharacterized protein LOC111886893 n=1 Tax=Lactuca sativa TaxID=4236 RepID=UPI000CD9BB4F|nr:uncharacterized protein LOC111886893 [Lactuca sativa]